jgi:hypothetical protein
MNLYAEKITELEPFGYERFVYKDRVPTCSLLMRLTNDKNVNQTDKLPYYDEGTYSTIYYMLTEEEKTVMKLRRKQFTAPIRMTMEIFLRHYGLDPSKTDAIEQEAFLSNLVKTDNKKSEMLDLNYHSQY